MENSHPKRTRLSLNINSFNEDNNIPLINNFRLSVTSSQTENSKQNKSNQERESQISHKKSIQNEFSNSKFPQDRKRRRFTVLHSNPQRFELKLNETMNINSNVVMNSNSGTNNSKFLNETQKFRSNSCVGKTSSSKKVIIEW